VGVTAASATLGPIIPPSLPFVIYGMMANVSVGALFLAGILPGVLMARADDADGGLLRAQERLGRRHQVRMAARDQGAGRDRGGHPAGRWRCGC
jgi:TRAP-type C4-dicarboxylate transport system permease large subunit